MAADGYETSAFLDILFILKFTGPPSTLTMFREPDSELETAARNVGFRWLRALLGIIGCGLLIATIPVFFPVGWMSTIHQWLGLGPFPKSPITIYLARSTSMLYAIHGSLLLFTAVHLRQHLSLVPLLGWLHVVIGLTMLGVDLTTPMPWYWTVVEGLPVAAMGGAILWLHHRVVRT